MRHLRNSGKSAAGDAVKVVKEVVEVITDTTRRQGVKQRVHATNQPLSAKSANVEVNLTKDNINFTESRINNTNAAANYEPVHHIEIGNKNVDNSGVAQTPANKPTQDIKQTQVDGDPISLCTGEELLNIDDGVLPGILPFTWQRLYRTSGCEQPLGLGYGWSHALAHVLYFEDDQIIWQDHENKRIPFQLPKEQDLTVTNQLAGSAIRLGEYRDEYIVSGQQGVYHFIRQGNIGRLMAIKDAYANTLTVHYDGSGRLQAIAHSLARLAFRYQSKESGFIHEVWLEAWSEKELNTGWQAERCLARYHYNEAQQLISATNQQGEQEHYSYTADHVIVQRQLAGGACFYWEWEGEGKSARCRRQYSNFDHFDTTYDWDDDQGVVTLTQADGCIRVYQHDQHARLIYQQDAAGIASVKNYDDKGHLLNEIDGIGQQTHYAYSADGKLSTIFTPDGRSINYTYLFGQIKKTRIQAGNLIQSWINTVSMEGKITQQEGPDGSITAYEYDDKGQLIALRHPDGQTEYYQWDKLGRLIKVAHSQGQIRRYHYQGLATEPNRISDEQQRVTELTYDAGGRLTTLRLADGATRHYRYNAYGKVTWFKDEMGRETHYEYAEPLHLLTCKTLPDGSELRYRYDNIHLQVSEIINQKDEVYRLRYTPTGLLSEEVGFDGIKTTYRYDANGQLIEKQEFGTEHDAEPLVTAYQRDPMGRLLVKTLPDSREVRYEYDGLGRLVFAEDNGQVLAWEYDIADRLTAEHQNWATLRHRYDEETGLLSGSRLPDGQWVDYHYQSGQLCGMTLNHQPLAAFDYDRSYQVRERRQGNGLVNQYHYDESGRLSQHQLQAAFFNKTNTLWQQQYDYQADGELTDIGGHQARQYRYDDVGQLQAADYGRVRQSHSQRYDEQFIYDAAGNRVSSQSRDSSPGNRLAFYADRHFDYDKFGNLISERRGKDGKLVTTYQYDCRHRLVKMESYTGVVATYTYDAFNRRTSKMVNGYKTEFIWQGNKLVAECSENDTVWQSYIYEPGSYRPLALVSGNKRNTTESRTYWYQNDQLGTPQLLTDSLGTIVYTGEYDAYGNLLRETHPLEGGTGTQGSEVKLHQPLRLQGQYYDAESGLYYNLNRYYDPQLGRYLTQDPIKLAGGLNAYQYVDGNPVGWVDPLGLFKQDGTGFENATAKTNTPTLPQKPSSSMADILATGKLPGEQGIVITDRSVLYSDLYKLSTQNESGIPKEILLVRQKIDGKMRHVIYSGEANRVGLPKNGRPIAHTHPTENAHQQWPSPTDMRSLNIYYDTQLKLNPAYKAKPHTIIWGEQPGQSTIIYPGPWKDPLPAKNPYKRN